MHGKNRQHQSLILRHLKSKQRGEEKQLHGLILTQVMNCSLALDQMERCRLVDHKMLKRVVCTRVRKSKGYNANNDKLVVGAV